MGVAPVAPARVQITVLLVRAPTKSCGAEHALPLIAVVDLVLSLAWEHVFRNSFASPPPLLGLRLFHPSPVSRHPRVRRRKLYHGGRSFSWRSGVLLFLLHFCTAGAVVRGNNVQKRRPLLPLPKPSTTRPIGDYVWHVSAKGCLDTPPVNRDQTRRKLLCGNCALRRRHDTIRIWRSSSMRTDHHGQIPHMSPSMTTNQTVLTGCPVAHYIPK